MWMGLWPDAAIYIPWDIWALTWMAASLWSARTVKYRTFSGQFLYRALTFAGFILLLAPVVHKVNGHYEIANWPGFMGIRIWPWPSLAVSWAMVAVAALGFAFAWWARIYLGRLWSGTITRKEGHRVVDTGPYAIVRHPIYTGIYIASFATLVIVGTMHAAIGTLCLVVGYWLKARMEENFLRQELGAEAYDSYRRRVPMLIPFGPKAA
jgi:protein-S-isoprenylcysteine O-methyltransferase Ste14